MKKLSILVLLTFLSMYSLQAGIYETGTASWYGGEFHGELTANGEIFDTYKISAAHQELPFGTIVRVTNMDNDLFVDVRINDRGPFMKERIIDLSYAAAQAIDMIGPGTAPVTLELLYVPEIPEDLYHRIPVVDYYRIQVAAFSSELNALHAARFLNENDFDASYVLGEDLLYRVAVQNVAKIDLDKALSKLDQLGFSFVLVRADTR